MWGKPQGISPLDVEGLISGQIPNHDVWLYHDVILVFYYPRACVYGMYKYLRISRHGHQKSSFIYELIILSLIVGKSMCLSLSHLLGMVWIYHICG